MLFLRIIGSVLFAGAIGCAIAASIVVSDMIEDINKLSPRGQQESTLFGYPGKLGRIKRKYQQLFPNGLRVRTLNRLSFVGIGLFIVGDLLIFAPAFFK
jgi:hypothetical protein